MSSPVDSWTLIERGENFAARIAADRLEYARREADWYRRKKKTLQRLSRIIRFFAMLCLTIGGVLPMVSKMSDGISPYLGYVFLTLGGSFLLADRVFGISAGWTRFMITASKIEALSESFRIMAIESIDIESRESAEKVLRLSLDLTQAISMLVQKETEFWASDMTSGREELTNLSKARRG